MSNDIAGPGSFDTLFFESYTPPIGYRPHPFDLDINKEPGSHTVWTVVGLSGIGYRLQLAGSSGIIDRKAILERFS